jgi:hypothetical protein
MTGRIAAMSIDGTPISAADVARMQAEEKLYAERRRRTARVVAAAAHNVDDCRMLLDMLGLDRGVVVEARGDSKPPTPRKRRSRAAA